MFALLRVLIWYAADPENKIVQTFFCQNETVGAQRPLKNVSLLKAIKELPPPPPKQTCYPFLRVENNIIEFFGVRIGFISTHFNAKPALQIQTP